MSEISTENTQGTVGGEPPNPEPADPEKKKRGRPPDSPEVKAAKQKKREEDKAKKTESSDGEAQIPSGGKRGRPHDSPEVAEEKRKKRNAASMEINRKNADEKREITAKMKAAQREVGDAIRAKLREKYGQYELEEELFIGDLMKSLSKLRDLGAFDFEANNLSAFIPELAKVFEKSCG
ncbi:MAG: hypothetical protein LBT59_22250, partial [Clostridiales bacterium]|nr:hypothetical protein [Clostridiales bacterium]